MFLRGMRHTGTVREYGGLGPGYDGRGTVVRCRGYGGYGAGGRVGTLGTVEGGGGYGGGVRWVRWMGTVGTVYGGRVRWVWKGIVGTVDRYNKGYNGGYG